MKIDDLVRALREGDLIAAREWVAESRRVRFQWKSIDRPTGLTLDDLAIAAGLAELLAERAGEAAPDWTTEVGGAANPILLDPGLDEMPRSFERAKTAGPAPLRKRNLLALPDFLTIA
jgi:hypothetical protein